MLQQFEYLPSELKKLNEIIAEQKKVIIAQNTKNNELLQKLKAKENLFSIVSASYGANIWEKLINFEGANILRSYINNSFAINQRSKEANKPKLWMDHILYNFMRQHIQSLLNIVNYKLEGKPCDLITSYEESVRTARNLSSNNGSLAWYINQRIPTTYIDANSVDYHLEKIFEIFHENVEVDVRRIHLFYENFFLKSGGRNFGEENTKSLFTILLIEYLHGIDNRVLSIAGLDEVEKVVFRDHNDFPENFLFLLDFALYFSQDSHAEIQKLSSADIISSSNYLYGEPKILCGDFTAENPKRASDTLEGEFTYRTLRYSMDKVYVLDNPIVYSMFKNYFLSMWNKDKYVNYLRNHFDEQIYNEGLKRLFGVLDKHIIVYDFFDFWRKAKSTHGISKSFDDDIFESKFLWKISSKPIPDRKQFINNLRKIIVNFDFSKYPDDKARIHQEFNAKLGKTYIMRDIKNYCNSSKNI